MLTRQVHQRSILSVTIGAFLKKRIKVSVSSVEWLP